MTITKQSIRKCFKEDDTYIVNKNNELEVKSMNHPNNYNLKFISFKQQDLSFGESNKSYLRAGSCWICVRRFTFGCNLEYRQKLKT